MPIAYYMRLVEAPSRGGRDRVGGVPSHLPGAFPVSRTTGRDMAFLFELYSEPGRFDLAGNLCLQAYQSCDVDDGDNPLPVIVVLPKSAPANISGLGTRQSSIVERWIQYERREEPEVIPVETGMNPELVRMVQSKLGGARPGELLPEEGEFLGQIREWPGGFNFGSYSLILLRQRDGEVRGLLL